MATGEQWAKIEPLLPKRAPKTKGGRPPVDNRRVLEVPCWSSRSAPHGNIFPRTVPIRRPAGGGSGTGMTLGALVDMRRAFLSELDHEGILEREEVLVDATVIPVKKDAVVGKTKRAKGKKCLVLVGGQGVPLGSHTDSGIDPGGDISASASSGGTVHSADWLSDMISVSRCS